MIPNLLNYLIIHYFYIKNNIRKKKEYWLEISIPIFIYLYLFLQYFFFEESKMKLFFIIIKISISIYYICVYIFFKESQLFPPSQIIIYLKILDDSELTVACIYIQVIVKSLNFMVDSRVRAQLSPSPVDHLKQ